MGDILSAASLLFAVSGILYGFWYPEIMEALDSPVTKYPENNIASLTKVLIALKKAFFLSVASLIFVLIFLPSAVKILNLSIKNMQMNSLDAYRDYDPVQASLIFVLTCSSAILVHLVILFTELKKKKDKFPK